MEKEKITSSFSWVKKCLLKSANFSFRRDVSGITPSSVVANDKWQMLIFSVFHTKKTYTGLLTNLYSFVPFGYKLGLVLSLVDRAFVQINNTWVDFTNTLAIFPPLWVQICSPHT